jgi:hypothetical protein
MIMSIQYKLTAIAVLVGAGVLMLPSAQAKGSDAYDAYEDLSGTHAATMYDTKDGARGREGTEGEMGMAGKKSMGTMQRTMDAYDAYEDLSGTHATKRTPSSGAQGPSGSMGVSGSAGRATDPSPLFRIPGDVADGCSKYLRCAGDY